MSDLINALKNLGNSINNVSKKSFDLEYSTQWRKEYEHLLSIGIKPSFIRLDRATGIRQYKYTKTPELFSALAKFYIEVMEAKEEAKEEAMEAKYVEAK